MEVIVFDNYIECEKPISIADDSGTSEFSLKNAKILFRNFAKILKAEVKVKVWCSECNGTGKFEGVIRCEVCDGLGYQEKPFAELK